MNKQKIIEIVAKVLVAALTAFITAITTTSCKGRGPFYEWPIDRSALPLCTFKSKNG